MKAITYELKLADGTEHCFVVDINREHPEPESLGDDHAAWTRLDFCRCESCPLDQSRHRYCPTAIDIEQITKKFWNTTSIERADVWVHTENRSYFKNCDTQTYLMSLYGLIMSSSACPIFSRLKPMAHFHLPFARMEETVYRLTSTYLLNQYLKKKQGKGEADWELNELREFYSLLKNMNMQFMKRLRNASQADANINAQQIFVSTTMLVEMGIDDILISLAPLFDGL